MADLSLRPVAQNDSTATTGCCIYMSPEEVEKRKQIGELFKQISDSGEKLQIPIGISGGIGNLDELIKKLTELKEKRDAALEKLDKKKSSMGITYAEARKTMEEIEAKHKSNTNPLLMVLKMQKFDPNKLEEPDKSRYFQAMAACIEIENANKDLAMEAGRHTEYPNKKDDDFLAKTGTIGTFNERQKEILLYYPDRDKDESQIQLL